MKWYLCFLKSQVSRSNINGRNQVWDIYVDTQSIKDYRRCVYCLHYNTMSAWTLKKVSCMLIHIDPYILCIATANTHRSRLIWKVASILKTGLTLKCRSGLAFDFTSQTHLEFFFSPRHVHFNTLKHLFLALLLEFFNPRHVHFKLKNLFLALL